jgi:hypothetical protein
MEYSSSLNCLNDNNKSSTAYACYSGSKETVTHDVNHMSVSIVCVSSINLVAVEHQIKADKNWQERCYVWIDY